MINNRKRGIGMAIDIGDKPVTLIPDVTATSILAVQNDTQVVRIDTASLLNSLYDFDGGDAFTLSQDVTFILDGGGA
jgi:hypothetical protein